MRIETSPRSNVGMEREGDPIFSPRTLADMPAEVVVHIVRSDPNASWNLAVASRQFETIVLAGVLAPLLSHFSDSISETRSYLSRALAIGRTPAQIVALSDALSMRDAADRTTQLTAIGLCNQRVHRAICQDLLQFLCQPNVLLHAFENDQRPLIWDDELDKSAALIGREIPQCPRREILSVEGRRVYASGLDRILLNFMDAMGQETMEQFAASQFAYRKAYLHANMLPDSSRHVRETVYRVAEDIRIIGVSLLRYLPAEKSKPYMEGRPVQNGVLYPVVRRCQAISLSPLYPTSPRKTDTGLNPLLGSHSRPLLGKPLIEQKAVAIGGLHTKKESCPPHSCVLV